MKQLVLLACLVLVQLAAASTEYWTPWMNNDDPGGIGDYEILDEMEDLCGGFDPIDIRCRVVGGEVGDDFPDEYIDLAVPCTLTPSGYYGLTGFGCYALYEEDETCEDYEIQVKCRKPDIEYWTKWIDMDDPDGIGDYEILENMGDLCGGSDPVDIECRVVGGEVGDFPDTYLDWAVPCTLTPSGYYGYTGIGCYALYEPDGICADYEIRVKCITYDGCTPNVGRCRRQEKCECRDGSWDPSLACRGKRETCCVPNDSNDLAFGSGWYPCPKDKDKE